MDKVLKSPSSDQKGLKKLPTEVRNKMGYKKRGGTVKMKEGGSVKGVKIRGTGAATKGLYARGPMA